MILKIVRYGKVRKGCCDGNSGNEFTIFHHQDFGKDNTVATLQFKKSGDSDMYFFNSYNLLLKNEQQADPVKQTFYVSKKDDNITLKRLKT